MARILIVDDEEPIRDMLLELLERRGHTAQAAEGGIAAAAAWENDRFDVVITDLRMPEGGGVDVLRASLAQDALVEVLVLTGYGSVSSAVEAMRLGASEYLMKPIDPRELMLKVEQALARRELRHRLETQQQELQAYQEMIARDLDLAARVQASLVPEELVHERFDVAVRYSPVMAIGGDFADVFYDGGDTLYLTILDVTGHGIAAALLVNRLTVEVRRLVREGYAPAAVLLHLNELVCDAFAGTGMFLTAFCCRVSFERGCVEYAGSAHPPALLCRAGSSCERLPAHNPLIGFDRLDAGALREDRVLVGAGDTLLLYTDGAIDVQDANGEQLGVHGLAAFVEAARSGGAQATAKAVLDGVAAHSREARRDDLSVLALQIK